MADNKNNNNKGGGESKPQVALVSLVDFCDANGVNSVDRNAVFMKYGKNTAKSEADWSKELEGKITIKK